MSGETDRRFMRTALLLGERGLGICWPNPSVGCVIVREGRIVGRGWTGRGGRPHAETEALRRAGAAARGATVYVTLEPCAHHGRTPPCTEALIGAGVARLVVACLDPDPRVDGRGIAALRKAGIRVDLGCGAEEARFQHAGLFRRIRDRRPLVAVKLATSLDGRIATASGHSRWITGPRARLAGHRLRATHDAVMVGSGTVLADDPRLTCRLPGLEDRSPVRIVADRRLRLSPDARLLAETPRIPLWILTRADPQPDAVRALETAGAEVLPVAEPFLANALARLAERGITRLLVEGGGELVAALLREDLVDRLHLATAPLLLGGDARAAVGALELARVDVAARFVPVDDLRLGEDHLALYVRKTEETCCSPVSSPISAASSR